MAAHIKIFISNIYVQEYNTNKKKYKITFKINKSKREIKWEKNH